MQKKSLESMSFFSSFISGEFIPKIFVFVPFPLQFPLAMISDISFAAGHSRGKKKNAALERMELDKNLISFKIIISFVCLVSVHLLLSSMAVLYHVNDSSSC